MTKQIDQDENDERKYSKKEAAELLGVTPETIRNWERNRLLTQKEPYSRRRYQTDEIRRMYVIRLLLDTGYSCMAILRFLTAYDDGLNQKATGFLLGTVEDAELQSRADQYLKSLIRARTQAETSENEILILMKKYCRPERYTINAELIQKITKSLAALHTDVPPSFMCKDQKKAEPLSDQIITECLFGWKSVLAEHPGSRPENRSKYNPPTDRLCKKPHCLQKLLSDPYHNHFPYAGNVTSF